MTLSRCGRVYPTFDEALKAAQQLTYKTGRTHQAMSCWVADHWHVIERAAASASKLDPFPPLIARLIDARDEGQCQRCGRSGRSGRLERHHRRAKSMGGSKARSHTQCPCNALSLCRRCHAFVHEHPAEARQNGWIVRQGVAEPKRIAVTICEAVFDPDLNRYIDELVADEFWATCDGRWVHSPLETED